jgi:hypothetical protein
MLPNGPQYPPDLSMQSVVPAKLTYVTLCHDIYRDGENPGSVGLLAFQIDHDILRTSSGGQNEVWAIVKPDGITRRGLRADEISQMAEMKLWK